MNERRIQLSRRRLLRVSAIGGLAAVAAAALAGCGETQIVEVVKEVPVEKIQVVTKEVPVEKIVEKIVTVEVAKPKAKGGTLVFWTGYGLKSPNIGVGMAQTVKDFEGANPGWKAQIVTVPGSEYFEKLSASLIAGLAPDLTYIGRYVGSFVRRRWLHEMEPILKSIGYPTQDLGDIINSYKVDGKIWHFPVQAGIKSFVYRKDFFDEAGVKDVPQTHTQFAEAAAKLTKRDGDKITRSGFRMPTTGDWEWILNWARGNGGALEFDDPIEGKATVNKPKFVEAFTKHMDLKRVHKVAPMTGTPADPSGFPIISGGVAIELQGPWWVPVMRQQGFKEAQNLGVFAPLKGDGADGQPSSWGFTDGYLAMKTNNDVSAVTAFLASFWKEPNYIAYHESDLEGQLFRFPSPLKAINAKLKWLKEEPLMQGDWAAKWLDYGYPGAQNHLAYGEIITTFGKAIERGLQAGANDQALLDEAAAAADKITEREKEKAKTY